MSRFFIVLLGLLSFPLCSFNINHHDQLILVLAEGWGSNRATVWCFEKNGPNDKWKESHSQLKARLGAKGLAWGRGLHSLANLTGPKKNEADNHSPAGIFPVGPIVGFQRKDDISLLQMPYIHINPSILAVDDTNSPFYNQIVDAKFVTQNWESAMQLSQYSFMKWGAVIDYNSHPSISNEGSCIFLCVDNEEFSLKQMTSTCLEEQELIKVLYWLKQSKKPLIVQLTKQDYLKLKSNWKLPGVEWKK